MDLMGIKLSEKSQSQKGTYYMILFINHSWNNKITDLENRLVVASKGRYGGEEIGVAIKG